MTWPYARGGSTSSVRARSRSGTSARDQPAARRASSRCSPASSRSPAASLSRVRFPSSWATTTSGLTTGQTRSTKRVSPPCGARARPRRRRRTRGRRAWPCTGRTGREGAPCGSARARQSRRRARPRISREQRLDLVFAHAHVGAVEPRLEGVGPRLEPELDGAPHDLGQAEVGLQALDRRAGRRRDTSMPSTSSATARWSTLSSPRIGRTCET